MAWVGSLIKMLIVSLIATILLSCCYAETVASDELGPLTECIAPRSEMCTREYMPVCGVRDTGIRCVKAPCPSIERKTYSNACVACSDLKVSAYSSGGCDSTE